MMRIRYRNALLLLGSLFLLSGCGGGETPTEALPGQPDSLQRATPATTTKIEGYTLVESRQLDDTTMEYTYRADLSGDAFPATRVSARVIDMPDGITLVDATLNFDDVAANSRRTSTDTFVVQRDINQPFFVEELIWAFDHQRNTNLTLAADRLELRLRPGESGTIRYVLQAFNDSTANLDLSVRETAAGALQLNMDNSGQISLPPGANYYSLAQEITALEVGRHELTLVARLSEAGIEQSTRVAVLVEADSDGDSVPDAIDLCPDSSANSTVNSSGCNPADVTDSSAFRDLQLGQITFRVREDNLQEQYNNGILTSLQASGSLLLLTPLGEIALHEAQLIFEYGDTPLAGIERLRGTAQVPFPSVGLLANADIGTPVMADVGLDYGRNLADLDAPLVDDRQYLFFNFNAGFEASVGPISFEAPGGQSATFVLDPQDPFFFLTGSLPGLSEIAGVEDLGIAMSLQGLIPFTPDTTWGIDDGIGNFDANLHLQGSIPFARLPLNLDGALMIDADANNDGNTLFNNPAADVEYGGNGTLNVSVDFLQFFGFGFELGNASLGIKITDNEQKAYFSGVLAPDTGFLPQELVPIRPATAVNMAGLISSDISQSYLHGEGEFALDGSTLSRLSGINLDNLRTTSATFSADSNGVRLTGLTRSSLYPGVGFDGDAQLDANFTGSPSDWGVGISGQMDIAGTPISQGQLNISSTGLSLSGDFVTPLTRVAMSGQINASGIEMRGNSGITIPISVVEGVTKWVVDGAVCGYETVKDGALCGFDTVTDGAVCGYKTVTSSALCGTKWVGSFLDCIGSFVSGKGCREVAASCSVADTCDVPASCDIPSGCNTTVEVNTPKGEFRGDIELLLGNDGMGGDVSGEYCFAGDCTILSGGRVRASGSGLQACITIPAGIGEVCQSL